MDRLFDKDMLIVNESPTSKDILMSNFQFSPGRDYFSNSSGGYLGWGLGAAIGAKLASPKRRVVACLGDGSTMFGLQGLWTLAKYRIPLVVIVFNNRAYMAVKNQFRGSEERIRIAADMGAEITGPEINFASSRKPSASMANASSIRTRSSRRSNAPWNKTARRWSMS